MKYEATRTTNGRYFQNRRETPSSNGVYDDFNECVFPHVYFMSNRRSIHPIPGTPNQNHPSRAPLISYLGPRDTSRAPLPSGYSTSSSIPDGITSMDYDGESDVSSLSEHEGRSSSDITPPRGNDLNYQNNSGDRFFGFIRHPNSQTSHFAYITLQYSDDDEDSSYYTSEETYTTDLSTNFGSNRELKTSMLPLDAYADKDTLDIKCLFGNKFFRDFLDKIFGRTRQLPVFEFPPSSELYGFTPDADELSYGSSSLESSTSRWSQ